VTAAVVGVILNLTLVFGASVILSDNGEGGINWFAALVTLAAFLVLFFTKIGVIWIVLAGGIIGLAAAAIERGWII
jgi:chromate transporter